MTEEKQIKRCAVYTRKSHEEGLDQKYNSLDAQRESAENFIKSQKNNGWQLIPEHYDDGGYSGGNMERPALKRLLADVEDGKIDIILIYKLDRLSRSLQDFMKLVEMLEQHNVSFVSVTQDINTSTSSGRMMLNILMTFSQYEREIIGERILDRIAGKKRRGKYCGGVPVLGYDADSENKKLVVNEAEAKAVREAFLLYSQYGSAMDTAMRLNELGYRTKDWTTKRGRHNVGRKFVTDNIYRMLNNVTYIGMVEHKGQRYQGEHNAIIEQKLWDSVQALLRENSPVAIGSRKNAIASPFKGLLRCGHCGGAFGITYARNNKKKSDNRRYMYYECIKNKDQLERRCPLSRIPAGDIDRVILEQIARIFKTPSMLTKTVNHLAALEKEQISLLQKRQEKLTTEQQSLRARLQEGGDIEKLRGRFAGVSKELDEVERELNKTGEDFSTRELLETCDSMEKIWDELFPVERYRLAHLLIDRIQISIDHMIVDVKTHGLRSLIKELGSDESIRLSRPKEGRGNMIRLTIPLLIRRRHGRKIVLGPENAEQSKASRVVGEHGLSALALHLARGYAWNEMLESGKVDSIAELARQLDIDKTCITRDLRLLDLAPDFQKLAAEGREPESLSLTRLREPFPEDWDEQRKMFGLKNQEAPHA